MEDQKKPFTWRELKQQVNNIPEEQLDKPVRIWGEDEAHLAAEVVLLEEDYHETGYGCAPLKDVKEMYKSENDSDDYDFNTEHPLAYEKGTPILYLDF